MADEPLYTDVLVPTDGSEAASVAVDHALTVAAAHGATIHGLFVIDSRITMAADQDMRDQLTERLHDTGQDAVEEIVDRATELGLEASGAVERGTPWKVIRSHAEDQGIDLIVIGTTGKTPREKRMRMGSVSERVVDDAQIPVLVVPNLPT